MSSLSVITPALPRMLTKCSTSSSDSCAYLELRGGGGAAQAAATLVWRWHRCCAALALYGCHPAAAAARHAVWVTKLPRRVVTVPILCEVVAVVVAARCTATTARFVNHDVAAMMDVGLCSSSGRCAQVLHGDGGWLLAIHDKKIQKHLHPPTPCDHVSCSFNCDKGEGVSMAAAAYHCSSLL